MDRYFTNNLTCNIIFCGSSKEGESIVVIIKDDNSQIVFVVDCFKDNEEIVPLEVLKNKGISKIDYLVWTHPHDDHTLGIENILSLDVGNILIPFHMDCSSFCKNDYYKSIYDKIVLISKKGCDNRKKTWISLDFVHSAYETDVCEYIINSSKTCKVQVEAFAPEAQRIMNISNDINANLNDYSIGFNLIIGDFVLSLTSDVENNTIEYNLKRGKGFNYYPNIIKIPHHGSDTSTEILLLYDYAHRICSDDGEKDSLFGVTTSMSSNNLPNLDALEEYKKTIENVLKIDTNATGKAVLEYEIDMIAATITQKQAVGFIKA